MTKAKIFRKKEDLNSFCRGNKIGMARLVKVSGNIRVIDGEVMSQYILIYRNDGLFAQEDKCVKVEVLKNNEELSRFMEKINVDNHTIINAEFQPSVGFDGEIPILFAYC